jgi:hypothetical protein
MIPTYWKDKIMEILKISETSGKGGMIKQSEGFLEPWNYSVRYYNGGYISLHICQN